jgi:hypothetical protein
VDHLEVAAEPMIDPIYAAFEPIQVRAPFNAPTLKIHSHCGVSHWRSTDAGDWTLLGRRLCSLFDRDTYNRHKTGLGELGEQGLGASEQT